MVAINISLERNEYAAGETAKGILTISEDKEFKVQSFELSVSGEERIVEISEEKSFETRRITAQESNIFFSKDLSNYLNSIGTKIEEEDDNMLQVPGGVTKVPFEFNIPDDALESYEGKHASTIYKIEAAVNMP